MKIYFDLPEFDLQFLRTLAPAYYKGADIGECWATAAKIKPGDFNSWYEEWLQTAHRLFYIGENALKEKNQISACEAYFKASNYYRTAFFFLYGNLLDTRLVETYDCHVNAFEKALKLQPFGWEKVKIPFENSFLPGYFFRASDNPGPTVILHSGYDGTSQECFFSSALAALERGYHALCFDGPGQGYCLFKQNLYMRPNWESVISPVINFLLKRADVNPNQLILIGQSWGGYLAPRAACYEPRLAALVTNPGQYEALTPLRCLIPSIDQLIEQNDDQALERLVTELTKQPLMNFKINSKMWIHGLHTPIELLKAWKQYSLVDLSKNIRCSSLVLDSENEAFSQGQAKQLYESLTCQKDYYLFTHAQGAGEHCGLGAYSLVNQIIFDWLGRVFTHPK